MRILLVTPYYPPDLGPSAPLLGMLAEDLAAQGHPVVVIAAVPHYPSGQVSPGYRGRMVWVEKSQNLTIYRVWVPSGDRSNLFHRLLSFLAFQILATLVGLWQHYDALLLTNPAIETGLPYLFLAWLRRKPCLLCVWDMYPEVMQRMGVVRNQKILSLVRLFEDFTLHGARLIQVLHPSFIDELAAHRISPQKVVVIPPWIDTAFLRPLPKLNTFSQEHGLEDGFNVLYAGNFGFSQGLENVIDVAGQLKEHAGLRFIFVGDGAQRQPLVERIKALGLSNVMVLPFQPRERLPEVLATADVSLISLRSGLLDGSLPSKTFPILASGRPVLALVDPGCGIWNLVEQSGTGVCIPPAQKSEAAEQIIYLKENSEQRKYLGEKARSFAVAHYDRLAACKQFVDVLNKITGEN